MNVDVSFVLVKLKFIWSSLVLITFLDSGKIGKSDLYDSWGLRVLWNFCDRWINLVLAMWCTRHMRWTRSMKKFGLTDVMFDSVQLSLSTLMIIIKIFRDDVVNLLVWKFRTRMNIIADDNCKNTLNLMLVAWKC